MCGRCLHDFYYAHLLASLSRPLNMDERAQRGKLTDCMRRFPHISPSSPGLSLDYWLPITARILHQFATGFCHKSYDTQFQTHFLLFIYFRQAPLDDWLSQHLSPELSQLCDYSIMPRTRPISNRLPGVDQSLLLLLWLDLGPRPRVFDSPPLHNPAVTVSVTLTLLTLLTLLLGTIVNVAP